MSTRRDILKKTIGFRIRDFVCPEKQHQIQHDKKHWQQQEVCIHITKRRQNYRTNQDNGSGYTVMYTRHGGDVHEEQEKETETETAWLESCFIAFFQKKDRGYSFIPFWLLKERLMMTVYQGNKRKTNTTGTTVRLQDRLQSQYKQRSWTNEAMQVNNMVS